MNEIERLKALDARAATGPTPRIDVTAGVLRTIAARRTQRPRGRAADDTRVLWAMAVAAVVVAMVSLGMAWQDLAGVSDPLQGLFGHFAMVMQ